MVAVPEPAVTSILPVLLTVMFDSASPKVAFLALVVELKVRIPVYSGAAAVAGASGSVAGAAPTVILPADTMALSVPSAIAKVPRVTVIFPIFTVEPEASPEMLKPLVASSLSIISMVNEPSPVRLTAPLSPLM